MFNRRYIVELSRLAFADGWAFVAPYFVLYLIWEEAHLPATSLKTIFWGAHLLNTGLAIFFFQDLARSLKRGTFVFWAGVLLVLWLPGAYLEFPADPWGHWQRTMAWSRATVLTDHPIFYKFSYFFAWTFLSPVSPLHQRTVLDLCSAAWQFLFAFQFYRLFRALGFSEALGRLLVVTVLALFGTNLFSFRYYALASTPVAYIAYLRLLILCLEAIPKWSYGRDSSTDIESVRDGFLERPITWYRRAVESPLLLLLIWYNHKQEILLLAISLSALALAWGLSRARRITLALLVLALGLGIAASRHPLGFLRFIQLERIAHLVGAGMRPTWEEFQGSLTRFFTFRIWDPHSQFFETLAVHGFLGVLGAVAVSRKYLAFACLILFPVLLSLYPPFVLLLSSLTHQNNAYRILYAFPTSCGLVVALWEGFAWLITHWETRKGKALRSSAGTATTVCLLILLAAMPAQSPWRNRAHFQWHRPAPDRTLVALDETANWFSKNRNIGPECPLLTDDVTDFVLGTELAWKIQSGRTTRESPIRKLTSEQALWEYVKKNPVCAVLVANGERLPGPLSPSWVAEKSGHWDPSCPDVREASGSFAGIAAGLVNRGWSRHPVPPFYWLYEPPR